MNTLNAALIQSLFTIGHTPIKLDSCFWVSEKDPETVWIYMETKTGHITSHIVPLSVLKQHLFDALDPPQ